jgi:hypothetical protein
MLKNPRAGWFLTASGSESVMPRTRPAALRRAHRGEEALDLFLQALGLVCELAGGVEHELGGTSDLA